MGSKTARWEHWSTIAEKEAPAALTRPRTYTSCASLNHCIVPLCQLFLAKDRAAENNGIKCKGKGAIQLSFFVCL